MGPKTPRDVLLTSCSNHCLYPRNLVGQKSPQRIDAYVEKLAKEEHRLFDEKARVNILDDNGDDDLGGAHLYVMFYSARANVACDSKGFTRSLAISVENIKDLVQFADQAERNNDPAKKNDVIPRCRFMSVAPGFDRATSTKVAVQFYSGGSQPSKLAHISRYAYIHTILVSDSSIVSGLHISFRRKRARKTRR